MPSKLRATLVLAMLGLGAALATLVATFGLERSLTRHVELLRRSSPIIIERDVVLNAGTAFEHRLQIAWTPTAVAELVGGLDGLGSVSGVRWDRAYLQRRRGEYQRIWVLNASRELAGVLGLGTDCSRNVLWLLAQANDGAQAGTAWLNDEAVDLRPSARLLPIRAIAPSTASSALLGFRCAEAREADFRTLLFLPAPGREADALSRLLARARRNGEGGGEFAASTVRVEPFSEAVARTLGREYRWLAWLSAGFGLTVVLLVLGYALFDGSRSRTNFQIMRALGAPLRHLVRANLLRVLAPVLGAVGIAPLLLLAASVTAPARLPASLLLAGIPLAAAVLGLAVLLGWATHLLCATLGIDRRLAVSAHVAGSRWQAVAISLCLSVVCMVMTTFLLFSIILERHHRRLNALDLGYRVEGLVAIETIPTSERARSGEHAEALVSSPLMPLATRGHVSFLCQSPWSLDEFTEQHAHAAASIPAGPGILDVLGIASSGRDLQAQDMRGSKSLVFQANSAGFRNGVRLFGNPVGEVSGVLAGALTPRNLDLVFQAPSDRASCIEPTVLFRPAHDAPPDAADRLAASLSALLKDYAVQPPRRVGDIISGYREPLDRIRRQADLAFAGILSIALLITVLLTATYVDSRRRIIAIRYALGERPRSAAALAGLRALLVSVPGLLLAVAGWPLLELALVQRFAGMQALPLAAVAGAGTAIAAGVFVCAWLSARARIAGADLTSELRAE